MLDIPEHFKTEGWFPVPHYLYSPALPFTKSQIALLGALFHLHNRFSKHSPSGEFHRTDKQLTKESRLSPRTISEVRIELSDMGCIWFKLGQSHRATRYRLLLPVQPDDPLWCNWESKSEYAANEQQISRKTDDPSKNEY